MVIGYFKVATHLCISHGICIRVEPAAEEVMDKVIVEPQEQSEQARKEVLKDSAQGPVDPSAEQQPEGKHWCITPNLNLCNVYN